MYKFIFSITLLYCLLGCNSYKHRIVGEWEVLMITDELLSPDRINQIENERSTIVSYFKSGEYSEDFECYKESGRYTIQSDTLTEIANDIKYKIHQLNKKIMILKNTKNYIYYRKLNKG